MTGDGPLKGIRVVEVGTMLAAPFAATLFADFGAEVIKIEQPGVGDTLRQTGSGPEDNMSWSFVVDARNKRSVALDLRQEAGQELFRRLVADADVLVENFRPGTLERWELGWEELHRLNRRLVMVRISGFGQQGPYSDRAGFDRIALGFSGYMYPTGYPEMPPVRPAVATADYLTATFAAFSAMMALHWRDTGGDEGQMIDLGLYEAPFRISSSLMASFLRDGNVRERVGNRNPGFVPAGNFLTRDERWIQIAAGADGVWRRLATVMDRAELIDDPRYATAPERSSRADELETLVKVWVGGMDFADVERALLEGGVPAGGILSAADIAADPHYEARGNIATVPDDRFGGVPMPEVVPRLSRTPGRIDHAGPRLGADTHAVLGDLLGIAPEELDRLAGEGIIGQHVASESPEAKER